MPLLSSLRKFATSCLTIYYTYIDPRWQRFRLINYSSDIRSVIEGGSQVGSGVYCVFVYYETNGQVSQSVRNILAALQRRNVNTVIVTNVKLSESQSVVLTQYSHTLILRGNQGFDFGAYKDCVLHLQQRAPDLTRLIFLNDSVYYFSTGIDDFVDGLLGNDDSIAAFENWDPIHAYHLQSFALSVSRNVFDHPSFLAFWKGYTPVNNRLHAISQGEKKLSNACLKASNSTAIVYSTENAMAAAKCGATQLEPFEFFISSPIDIRHDKAFVFSEEALTGKQDAGSREVESLKFLSSIDGIYRGSPVHAGMMFFVWYTVCPLVKKDVVYREQYRFWEVEYVLRKRFKNEEVDEFLTMVRKKGTLKGLGFADQVKARIGAA